MFRTGDKVNLLPLQYMLRLGHVFPFAAPWQKCFKLSKKLGIISWQPLELLQKMSNFLKILGQSASTVEGCFSVGHKRRKDFFPGRGQ